MHEKISTLRDQLSSTLRSQFEREIQRSVDRINEAIAPYTRFVRAERNNLTKTKDEFQSISIELNRLKNIIEEQ